MILTFLRSMRDDDQLFKRTGQVETNTSCEFCPGQLRSVQKLIQITLLSHRFKTGRRIKFFGVLGTIYLLQGILQNQEKKPTKPDSCLIRASLAFRFMIAFPRPAGFRSRFFGAYAV
jgi:hypothetical protein